MQLVFSLMNKICSKLSSNDSSTSRPAGLLVVVVVVVSFIFKKFEDCCSYSHGLV